MIKLINMVINKIIFEEIQKIFNEVSDANFPEFGERLRNLYEDENLIIEYVLEQIGKISVPPYPITGRKQENNKYFYYFTAFDDKNTGILPDKYIASFRQNFHDKNVYDFSFYVQGHDVEEVITHGRMFRVMATISEIVKEFINTIDPDIIKIFAVSTNKPTSKGVRKDNPLHNRRANLYMAYIRQNLPSGYDVTMMGYFIDIKKIKTIGKDV